MDIQLNYHEDGTFIGAEDHSIIDSCGDPYTDPYGDDINAFISPFAQWPVIVNPNLWDDSPEPEWMTDTTCPDPIMLHAWWDMFELYPFYHRGKVDYDRNWKQAVQLMETLK